MGAKRFRLVPAVHVFLVRDGQVLLLKRQNTGFGDGLYSVIAGHLDGGEEVVPAAIREAREEAGITLDPSDLEVVGVMHRRSSEERVDFFLAASRWTGELTNCEPHKCVELAWYPVDDPPADMVPYVRQGLDNYRAGTWFDSFGWGERSD